MGFEIMEKLAGIGWVGFFLSLLGGTTKQSPNFIPMEI